MNADFTLRARNERNRALSALRIACDSEARRIHQTGVDHTGNFLRLIALLRASHDVLRAENALVADQQPEAK